MNNNNEQSIWKELNTLRMFIYLEKEPFTNKYHQILLTDEQYKKVSLFIYDTVAIKDPNHKCGNPNCDGRSLETDDNVVILPDKPDKINETMQR